MCVLIDFYNTAIRLLRHFSEHFIQSISYYSSISLYRYTAWHLLLHPSASRLGATTWKTLVDVGIAVRLPTKRGCRGVQKQIAIYIMYISVGSPLTHFKFVDVLFGGRVPDYNAALINHVEWHLPLAMAKGFWPGKHSPWGEVFVALKSSICKHKNNWLCRQIRKGTDNIFCKNDKFVYMWHALSIIVVSALDREDYLSAYQKTKPVHMLIYFPDLWLCRQVQQ